MKRARFLTEMDLDDDDAEFARRRRPDAPIYQPRPEHGTTSSGFFSLPAELIQKIYALALDSDRVDPPPSPWYGDHDTSSHGEIKYPARYKSWRWPRGIWANKLLRKEIMELAEDRLAKRQVRAELDLMVNGFVFFPTWLHLPPDLPGEIPFDLDVSLRIFSGEAFCSNDGWPRQPGSGFRMLLRLFNQLVHAGPSFGRHLELLSGKVVWAVNTLHLTITFPDRPGELGTPSSDPATWPETTHAIFRMLKALASSGLARGVLNNIHATATYTLPSSPSSPTTWDSTWPCAPRINDADLQLWRQIGFLHTHQRSLADDYRAPWDGGSGGPSQRVQKMISSVAAGSLGAGPLERRDSPVGVVVMGEGGNPQKDDWGLITPPTPGPGYAAPGHAAYGNGDVGGGKRRGTPGSGSGSVGAGLGVGGRLDDYSAVWTPKAGGGGLDGLDDYSLVMTPVTGGAVDEEERDW